MDAAALQSVADAYRASPTKEALERAAAACLPLCGAVARRFQGRGEDADDLAQVAALACVNALKRYMPERGAFAPYAAMSAAGAVRNHLRDHARLIKTPRALYEQTALMTRERERLTNALGREPTVSELSAALRWDMAKTVETLAGQRADTLPLDAPAGLEGRPLSETLGAEDAALASFEQNADVRAAMNALDDKQRELLRLRFLEGLSQRAAAQALGMTQMQVLRAEKRALGLLRNQMENTG